MKPCTRFTVLFFASILILGGSIETTVWASESLSVISVPRKKSSKDELDRKAFEESFRTQVGFSFSTFNPAKWTLTAIDKSRVALSKSSFPSFELFWRFPLLSTGASDRPWGDFWPRLGLQYATATQTTALQLQAIRYESERTVSFLNASLGLDYEPRFLRWHSIAPLLSTTAGPLFGFFPETLTTQDRADLIWTARVGLGFSIGMVGLFEKRYIPADFDIIALAERFEVLSAPQSELSQWMGSAGLRVGL